MRLRLLKLQKSNLEAKKPRKDLLESWKKVQGILYHQSLLYVLEIICLKLISCHQNDLLADYFGIKKTKELIPKKYFLPFLCQDIKIYV